MTLSKGKKYKLISLAKGDAFTGDIELLKSPIVVFSAVEGEDYSNPWRSDYAINKEGKEYLAHSTGDKSWIGLSPICFLSGAVFKEIEEVGDEYL